MPRKPIGRPTGWPKRVIDWQKIQPNYFRYNDGRVTTFEED